MVKVKNTTQSRVRVEGIGFIEPGEEREVPVDIARGLIGRYGFEEVKPPRPKKEKPKEVKE